VSNLERVQSRVALESLLRLRAVAEEFDQNGRNWRLGFEALRDDDKLAEYEDMTLERWGYD